MWVVDVRHKDFHGVRTYLLENTPPGSYILAVRWLEERKAA